MNPKELMRRFNNAKLTWLLNGGDIPHPPQNLSFPEGQLLLPAVRLPGKTEVEKAYNEVWEAIDIPGLSKGRDDRQRPIRPISGIGSLKRTHWVTFDPMGMQLRDAWEVDDAVLPPGVRPAGVEVLLAALLYPEWVASWGNAVIAMPALQMYWHESGMWDIVPCLRLVGYGSAQGIVLYGRMHNSSSENVLWPTVREL